jgi:hypothetical protein
MNDEEKKLDPRLHFIVATAIVGKPRVIRLRTDNTSVIKNSR